MGAELPPDVLVASSPVGVGALVIATLVPLPLDESVERTADADRVAEGLIPEVMP